MTPYDASPDSGPHIIDVPIRPSRPQHAVLYVLVLALGTGFGLQYASARMMGLEGVAPMPALLVIHVVLAAFFTAFLVLSGKLFVPSLRHLAFFLPVTILVNLGQLTVELIAAHHVPAGELTLIMSLLPIFVFGIAAAFRTERLTGRKSFGILLGVAASSAILLPSAFGSPAQLSWVAFTFLAPVTQAIGLVFMGRYWPKDLDPLQVATGNLVMGGLLMIPVTVVSGESFDPAAFTAAGALATGAFAFTVAAEFVIFTILLRRGGAVLASCADFIAVCAGLVFGYMLFGEVPTLWMGAAALLCLLALRFATDRPA